MAYFILDCFGNIVGNPKGYRTIKGANREQNRRGSKAFNAIWPAFYEAHKANPEHKLIARIEAREV